MLKRQAGGRVSRFDTILSVNLSNTNAIYSRVAYKLNLPMRNGILYVKYQMNFMLRFSSF